MICKHCGADNPIDALTCGACGKALEQPAPFSDNDPVPGLGARKRSRRSGLIALIALAVLALAAGLVFRKAVAEFFVRTFSSPEAYYQHVERRAIDDLAERVGAGYAFAFGEDGKGASHTARAEFVPAVDGLDWLDSVTLTGEARTADGALSAAAALSLNGSELLSADAYVGDTVSAVRLPLLNKNYLALDEDGDVTAFLSALAKAGLTRAEVEDLTKAVLTAAVEPLDGVERSNDTLTAEQISQRCTLLTVTIDEARAEKMCGAIADTLEENDAAQKLLDAYDGDASDCEALAARLTDSLLSALTDGGSTEMQLWVGADGSVRGRALTLSDGTGFRFACPFRLMKGAAGLDCAVLLPEGETFRLNGTLQRKSGKLEATAKRDGDKLDLFKLEYSDLVVKGVERAVSFRLEPDRDLAKTLDQPLIGTYIGRIALEGRITQQGDRAESDFVVQYRDDTVATANAERETTGPAPIEPVEKALSHGAWLRKVDLISALKDLNEALENAGVPKDLLRMLSMLLSQLLPDSAA